MVVAETI